jgi:hypothetical protein
MCILSLQQAASFAEEDAVGGRIRVMSSKKNEAIFNRIAIDLLNGNSRYVCLDTMIELLNDYEIVEFSSPEIEPAKEIILKEVAYRMLKYHYLPRIGDKIQISRYQQQEMSDTGIRSDDFDHMEPVVMLPVKEAVIKDDDRLKAIYWPDMVAQISSAIQKLWLKRIRPNQDHLQRPNGEMSIFNAAVIVENKLIKKDDNFTDYRSSDHSADDIVCAAEEKLIEWEEEGYITSEDMPMIAEMFKQFIILSNPSGAAKLPDELHMLSDTDSLRRGVLAKIKTASEIMQPSDYAGLAMLQSLIDEVISCFSHISDSQPTKDPLQIIIRDPRHSA